MFVIDWATDPIFAKALGLLDCHLAYFSYQFYQIF